MAFKRSAVRFRLAPPSVLRVLTSPCEHRGWQLCFAFSFSVDHRFTLQKRSSFEKSSLCGVRLELNSVSTEARPFNTSAITFSSGFKFFEDPNGATRQVRPSYNAHCIFDQKRIFINTPTIRLASILRENRAQGMYGIHL